MSKAKPHENPLVPNKKLRQIYALMTEARALDEFVTRAAAKAKAQLKSTRGEEACRVSTAVNLTNGDLISDSGEGLVIDLIAGRRISSLLRRLDSILSKEKRRHSGRAHTGTAQLPWTQDTAARLTMALGAAASIKAARRPNLVMAYAHGSDLSVPQWRRILKSAVEFELPIIFVVLPDPVGASRNLCSLTHKLGLPGFPVDSADAVALYRVAQESIGRAHGDASPILIECLAHRPSGKPTPQDDPIAQMRSFLLNRGIAGKAWLNGTGRAYQKQLQAGLQASRRHIQR